MNNTGIQPIQGRVLIKPDEVDELEGSIIKPLIAIEQQSMAQVKGTIIDFGEDCFKYQDDTLWADAPKVGDRVLISKYAGQIVWVFEEAENKRKKAIEYRLCNDNDIVAIITEDKEIRGYE